MMESYQTDMQIVNLSQDRLYLESFIRPLLDHNCYNSFSELVCNYVNLLSPYVIPFQ